MSILATHNYVSSTRVILFVHDHIKNDSVMYFKLALLCNNHTSLNSHRQVFYHWKYWLLRHWELSDFVLWLNTVQTNFFSTRWSIVITAEILSWKEDFEVKEEKKKKKETEIGLENLNPGSDKFLCNIWRVKSSNLCIDWFASLQFEFCFSGPSLPLEVFDCKRESIKTKDVGIWGFLLLLWQNINMAVILPICVSDTVAGKDWN